MSSMSINEFATFTFNFHRIDVDGLFSKDQRDRMLKWIDESRQLLTEILRGDQVQILHIWHNIYNNVYEQLTASMTTSKCLDILHAPPINDRKIDPCTTLGNIISSFDISIPDPRSLKYPSNSEYCIDGQAERILNFDEDYAATKLIEGTPKILINHQIFDVNRRKYDQTDVISEPDGILFLSVVLAHEITHGINLSRPIDDIGGSEHSMPKLMVFRSYSPGGGIDAGNLVQHLLLDGEINFSKPPPTPLMLFLVVSPDGTQVPLTNDVIQACINRRSFVPISELINSGENKNAWQLKDINNRNRSHKKLSPLFHFRMPTHDPTQKSSPTMPTLTPMMHKKRTYFVSLVISLLFVFFRSFKKNKDN